MKKEFFKSDDLGSDWAVIVINLDTHCIDLVTQEHNTLNITSREIHQTSSIISSSEMGFLLVVGHSFSSDNRRVDDVDAD